MKGNIESTFQYNLTDLQMLVSMLNSGIMCGKTLFADLKYTYTHAITSLNSVNIVQVCVANQSAPKAPFSGLATKNTSIHKFEKC